MQPLHQPPIGQAQPSRPVIAFLPGDGISKEQCQKAIRELQAIGVTVSIINAEWPAISLGDYCAFATITARSTADGTPPGVRRFIEAMETAGKPVIYLSLPATDNEAGPRPRFNMKRLLTDSWRRWNTIDAPRLGAALAYYALFSLAPLLVLIVSVTGLFFKRTIVQSGLLAQVHAVMGSVGVGIVRSIMENSTVSTGVIAGTASILMMLLGASGVFLELRDSLDTVWGVKPRFGNGLVSLLRERVIAFLTIIGTGVVATILLSLTAVMGTPIRSILHILPAQRLATAACTTALSLLIMTVVFALMYKLIPDIYIRWSDVLTGAAVTSVLFTIGRLFISLYLARAAIGSAYAASGSLILFLAWVYYSAQIFLFGAEFTHVYAYRHGSYSRPEGPRNGVRRLL